MSYIIKKYNRLSQTAKASIWFVFCSFFQRGVQFLGMPIYTRLMSEEQYGVYSVFVSWFNILCIFTSLNIYAGTFNKAMIKFEQQRKEYISSIQSMTTITAMIFSVIIFVKLQFFSELFGLSKIELVLLCVYLLFYPTLQYWTQTQRFKYRYKALIGVTVINSISSLGLGAILVYFSKAKSETLILVTVLVPSIICLYLYIKHIFEGKCFYNKDFWQWSLFMAIPLIPHALSEILLGHSDRLMINEICGPAQAGIYNIVYQISMAVAVLRTGINGSFIPWQYNSIKDGKYEDVSRATNILVGFMGVVTLGFVAIGPEIIKIAAPKSYFEAVIDVPPIMVSGFFIFLYILFVNVEIYYEKGHYVAVASVIGACLNIILNTWLIPQLGYLVAGYTTMISYVVMVLLHYRFLMRIAKDYLEIKRIFDIKRIAIISIVVLVSSMGIYLLYDYFVVRCIMVLCVLSFLYIKRREIKKLTMK